MDGLISRQGVIDAIEDENSKGHYSCFASYSDAQKFKQIVNELPSAERTGHWIRTTPAKLYECSACGQNVLTTDIDCYNYCHGCGARMKGGERNDKSVNISRNN